MSHAFRLMAALAVAFGSITCNSDENIEEAPSALVRLSPHGVSNEDAWRLFDRSVHSGHVPTQMAHVTLGGRFALSAVKAYGPAPYRMTVTSVDASLAFPTVDLSKVDGWTSIVLPDSSVVGSVDFQFEPVGSPGVVPELELWASSEVAVVSAPTDLAKPLPAGFVVTKEASAAEIAVGQCASFAVELTSRPDQLRRAHLIYGALGVVRPFELTRSINDGPAHGGAWIGGSLAERSFVEEIDPASLRVGPNEVSLCVTDKAARGVAIDKLRIVGELDHGNRLATRITNSAGENLAALLDADVASSTEIAAKDKLVLDFERFVSPDLVVLTGTAGEVIAQCADRAGRTSLIDSSTRATPTGALVVLGAGNRACASLVLGFPRGATLTDVNVIGSGSGHRVDWPRVTITSAAEHFGEHAFVGGFVARPSAMTTAIRVSVDGQNADSMTGDFGRLPATLERARSPVARTGEGSFS